jgi:hypothetical protein
VGSFSSVMHVRHAAPPELAAGLDSVMQDFGYIRSAATPLAGRAPEPPAEDEGTVAYAYGPLRGNWCTVVQVHFFEEDAVLPDVGEALSEALDTHVLSLDLQDGDVLYYHLAHRGEPLDEYTSDPMFFEEEPMSESELASLRHQPEAFVPLLPPGVAPEALSAVLDRGWWHAHDQGELDADGLLSEEAYESDDYFEADERMAALATLLQLNGSATDYPFVAWSEAGADAWSGFTLVTYKRAPDA